MGHKKQLTWNDLVISTLESLEWTSSVTLIGYSGGPDSTALLNACALLRNEWTKKAGPKCSLPKFIVAHLDHGLRPESAKDAEFCLRNAQELGFEVVIGRVDTSNYYRPSRGGMETIARKARNAFFCALIDRYLCLRKKGLTLLPEIGHKEDESTFYGKFLVFPKTILLDFANEEHLTCNVLLAHTLNDQAETVLMHICRGAGLEGAAGMRKCAPMAHFLGKDEILPYVDVYKKRPFLMYPREKLLKLLDESGIVYLEDPTNKDAEAGPRNRIRHIVLPALESIYPGVLQNIERFANSFRETGSFLLSIMYGLPLPQRGLFSLVFPGLFAPGIPLPTGIFYSKAAQLALPAAYQAMIFQEICRVAHIKYNHNTNESLQKLVKAPAGKTGPGNCEATRFYIYVPQRAQGLESHSSLEGNNSDLLAGELNLLVRPNRPKLLRTSVGLVLADIISSKTPQLPYTTAYRFAPVTGKKSAIDNPGIFANTKVYRAKNRIEPAKIRVTIDDLALKGKHPIVIAPLDDAAFPIVFANPKGLKIPITGRGLGRKDLYQYYLERGVPPSFIRQMKVVADADGNVLWYPKVPGFGVGVQSTYINLNEAYKFLVLVFLDQKFWA